MDNQTKKAIIILDMVMLAMTGAWIIFGISRGIDAIALIYNYVYVFIVAMGIILNLKLIYNKK